MSKQKSITELVNELQTENEALKRLERIANSYTKQEFGYSVKELHAIVQRQKMYEQKKKERVAINQGQQGTQRSM